jgi:hypothetical protein
MLFLLVMEVLNDLFQKADATLLFQQLPPRHIPYHASMYEDGLVLFLSLDSRDLQLMLVIFTLFENASGLG